MRLYGIDAIPTVALVGVLCDVVTAGGIFKGRLGDNAVNGIGGAADEFALILGGVRSVSFDDCWGGGNLRNGRERHLGGYRLQWGRRRSIEQFRTNIDL